MQGGDPAFLAIGTQVSAKYKGAYCEAKIKSVDKQIKVRVTLKGPHGNNGASITIRDKDIISINDNAALSTGVIVKLKHPPESSETVEATVKQIQDQSRYTVIFNDGDIATLKRNALCMKSGKHFNASESLDNLPLTHPEHFSSPASVGGSGNRGASKRRHKSGAGNAENDEADEDDEDSSSSEEGGDDDLVNDPYTSNIGRVVWAENTDKKTKARDSWFLALIVAPTASDTAKIRTKKEFLIRSFKDGRYYTVSKKDTQKFRHNESPMKKNDNPALKEAMERAITFLETRELPPHWDRDILISHEEESTNNSTTASSESEELEEDDEEDESPEEKDHLVAELYKHMEDRGSPIDKTPCIEGKDVDLYKLYRIVDKLGGNVRVSNKSLWRQVANKLGFVSTWGINQVRVHYNRYLRSFEDLNRTLGCTMVNHPKTSSTTALGGVGARHRQISGSSRVQMRGSSRSKAANEEKVLVSPALNAEGGEEMPATVETSPETPSTPNVDNTKKETSSTSGGGGETSPTITTPVLTKRSSVSAKKNAKMESLRKKATEEMKMTTRPRRDSTSSLAAAMQVKAQKDSIVGIHPTAKEASSPASSSSSSTAASTATADKSAADKSSSSSASTPTAATGSSSSSSSKKAVVRMDRNRETEIEAKKLQASSSPPKASATMSSSLSTSSTASSSAGSPSVTATTTSKHQDDNSSSSDERKPGRGRPGALKKQQPPPGPGDGPAGSRRRDEKSSKDNEEEDFQHLADEVDVAVGDKIRVFYKFDNIYEAKVKRVQNRDNAKWPRYFVHYQGWNARYDEWIKRSKIKENLSWSKDRVIDTSQVNNEPDEDKDSTAGPPMKEERKKPGPKPSRGTPLKKGDKEKSSRAGTPSSGKGSRTGSPALKRQSSRTSVKKETDSDEEDSESSSRKSSRLVKNVQVPTASPASSTTSNETRSTGTGRGRKRALKEESETEDVEVEKDDIKPTFNETPAVTAAATEEVSPTKAKRGRKAAVKVEDSGSEVEAKADTRSSRATPTREKSSAKPVEKPTPSRRGRGRIGANAAAAAGGQTTNEDEEDPYAFKEPENINDANNKKERKKTEESSGSEGTTSSKTGSKGKVESSDSTDSSSSDIETKKSSTRQSQRSSRKQVSSEDDTDKTDEEAAKLQTEVEPPPAAAAAAAGLSETSRQAEAEQTKAIFTKKQQEIFPNLASKMSTSSKSETIEDSKQTEPEPEITSSNRKQRKTPSKPKSDELIDSETESDSSNEDQQQPKSVTRKSLAPALSAAAAAAAASSVPKKSSKRKLAIEQPSSSASELIDNEDEPLIRSSPGLSRRSENKVTSLATSTLTSSSKKPAKTLPAATAAAAVSSVAATPKNEDDLDLVCGETIPGSPVHPSSTPASSTGLSPGGNDSTVKPTSDAQSTTASSASSNKLRLEMPFASVPESIQEQQRPAEANSQQASLIPATLPPTGAASTGGAPETPETASTPSRLSPSAQVNPHDNDGSKSPNGGDSSEVDMESLKAESVDIEGSSSGEARTGRAGSTTGGVKRKATSSDVGSRSPAPSRRKRRARESSRGGRGGGRGRHGSGRVHNDDTDESEEAKDATLSVIGSLDNDALAALAQRSPRSSKYNFYPDFDTNMDSNTRIAIIQQNIKNLKKAYQSIKSKLATTERQIKKIRRKEREKSDDTKSNGGAASSGSSGGGGNGAANAAIEASA